MANHTFNPGLPTLGAELTQPSPTELRDVRCFKYAELEWARRECGSDYVRYVLDNIPIFGKHKRVLIDIKIHDLKPVETPCAPGWHLDGSINPRNEPKQPELLTLFVTGEHARTEFLRDPISLPVKDGCDFAVMSRSCCRLIPEGYATWQIPSCTFGTYGDHHFHRGTPATGYERRLLVRTTETDIIKPQNKIYTPYTHQV